MTFADKVIDFNKHLVYDGPALPQGIRIMNPFRESEQATRIAEEFYRKYYNDTKERFIILGINPGRFGGGLTGIPFTDPKRLESECKIRYIGKPTHEPSSVFVYEAINAYGGAKKFYSRFYINSLSPLGFTSINDKGGEKNYNYYDSKELQETVTGFIIDNIHKQIALGVNTNICFCFGTGKNETFLRRLNDRYHFFREIIALEHPRFIMQYKSATRQVYIDKYVNAFRNAGKKS